MPTLLDQPAVVRRSYPLHCGTEEFRIAGRHHYRLFDQSGLAVNSDHTFTGDNLKAHLFAIGTNTEAVTRIDTRTLRNTSRLELTGLGSARTPSQLRRHQVPPKLVDKAAAQVVPITKNHPLPNGNKRLTWQSLTMFCALDDHELGVPPDEARIHHVVDCRRRT